MNAKKLMFTAIMGASAYLLMFFAFPILFALPFLKIDFSDIPLLLTTFLYGPLSGALAALIRTLLHYIQTGGDAGYPIGDLASFLASLAYIYPIYYLLRGHLQVIKSKDRQLPWPRLILIYGLATLSLTLVMVALNYFVLAPFYSAVMNFPINDMVHYLLMGIVPFNLVKGVLVSIVAHFFLGRLLPILDRWL